MDKVVKRIIGYYDLFYCYKTNLKLKTRVSIITDDL